MFPLLEVVQACHPLLSPTGNVTFITCTAKNKIHFVADFITVYTKSVGLQAFMEDVKCSFFSTVLISFTN